MELFVNDGKLPLPHVAHEPAPAAEYSPALQFVQVMEPLAENVPAAQVPVRLVALQDLPAGHAMHALWFLSGWYVPLSHGVHSLPSALECVPAGQTAHVPLTVSALPLGHTAHDFLSALGTWPAGHAAQKAWSVPVCMSAPLQAVQVVAPFAE